MSATTQLPNMWLPADQRLEELIRSNAEVLVRTQENRVILLPSPMFSHILEANIDTANPCELRRFLQDNNLRYLLVTETEVKQRPDCEGWWWRFYDDVNQWRPWFIEYSYIHSIAKGYYVCAEHFPRPKTNPITGEELWSNH